MNGKLDRMVKDESGITALETAIILIAFVVVAAIFAFTILSTGTFLTERSKEAAYAGLQEVRGSMELKGSVLAQMTTSTNTVDSLVFTLANVAGGQPVNLAPSGANWGRETMPPSRSRRQRSAPAGPEQRGFGPGSRLSQLPFRPRCVWQEA